MPTSSLPSPGSSRFQFVDLLRGWAVLVMIETHVVNALLQVSLKEQPLFPVVTFINGLVAPSFLFCAGFALAISLHRKWMEFISFRKTFWRYIFRLLFILVVGYSLHLPIFSLQQLRALHDDQRWLPFFQSDILQVISLTLLFLVLLAVVLRREQLYIRISAIIALCIIFISPIVRELDYSSTAMWLRPYFSIQYKSQFPLFPWSAFLMSGTLFGFWFLRVREMGKDALLMPRLALLAFGGIVLSLLVEIIPLSLYPNHDFWRASPEFFFVRLGVVLLCSVGLWKYEQRGTISSRSLISLFGQESLLVYTVHLLIVYGHTYEWSFISLFGPSLSYLECLGLFAALTLAMFLLAYGWHSMKQWNSVVAKYVQFAVLAAIVIKFILK